MPHNMVSSYSKRYDIPEKEVESVWKQVYNRFREPKPYPLIVKLFKNRMAKVIRERNEKDKSNEKEM